jgi:hypothetical protein
MKSAMPSTATTTSAGSVSAPGRRAASLRSAVGGRGRIPSGTRENGMHKATTTATNLDADIELVAARGRRAAALRGLVGTPGRTPRDARNAA